MNRLILINIIRFVLLVAFQVLLFKRVELAMSGFSYLHIIIYPLFILLLPLRTPKALLVFLGFIMGITIDIFYNSLGVHASALVFTAYFRNTILKFLEPHEGYQVEEIPSLRYRGFTWFLSYASILMLIHLLFYFSVEAFSFVYYYDILLKTLVSFVFSVLIILMQQFIFRSKT